MTASTTLPAAVRAALLEALDDEYKAYAAYAAILDRFGEVRPFANIIEAEQRHATALIALMRKYGMEVPDNPYLTGDKPLPPLPASVEEACRQGVEAEVENAALYRDRLLPAVAGYADITRVMTNLSEASANNHLPAFQRCAGRGGGGGHGRGHGGGQGRRWRGGRGACD